MKNIENTWMLIEKIIHFFFFDLLKLKLSDLQWKVLIQFFKFSIVGAFNTALNYIIYIVLVKFGINYVVANIIGFTISVCNSYYWNNRYVFVFNNKVAWWKTFLKTYISYAGTGIIFSNILLVVWIELFYISELIAPLINLLVTIPLNFIINKYWAYKK